LASVSTPSFLKQADGAGLYAIRSMTRYDGEGRVQGVKHSETLASVICFGDVWSWHPASGHNSVCVRLDPEQSDDWGGVMKYGCAVLILSYNEKTAHYNAMSQ